MVEVEERRYFALTLQEYHEKNHRVKSGEIAIPEIQRPFVWDATKVRNLLDSLYQGYPVGYLIAWRNPTVKLNLSSSVRVDSQTMIGDTERPEDAQALRVQAVIRVSLRQPLKVRASLNGVIANIPHRTNSTRKVLQILGKLLLNDQGAPDRSCGIDHPSLRN